MQKQVKHTPDGGVINMRDGHLQQQLQIYCKSVLASVIHTTHILLSFFILSCKLYKLVILGLRFKK